MKPPLITIGSLFSGIGGIELGFERTGTTRPVWFFENDPHCVKVLTSRWPDVPVFSDVRKEVKNGIPPAQVICGGFP